MKKVTLKPSEIRNQIVWEASGQVAVLVGEKEDGTQIQELRSTGGDLLEVTIIPPLDVDAIWQAVADEREMKTGKKVSAKDLQAIARAKIEKRKRKNGR